MKSSGADFCGFAHVPSLWTRLLPLQPVPLQPFVRGYPITCAKPVTYYINPSSWLEERRGGGEVSRSVLASMFQVLISVVFPLPEGQREHLCFSLSITRDSWWNLSFWEMDGSPVERGNELESICIHCLQRAHTTQFTKIREWEWNPLTELIRCLVNCFYEAPSLYRKPEGFY